MFREVDFARNCRLTGNGFQRENLTGLNFSDPLLSGTFSLQVERMASDVDINPTLSHSLSVSQSQLWERVVLVRVRAGPCESSVVR